MKASITIFLIGLVLGSTLGIGGLWTQVVQPAYAEITTLEEEQGVMQQALDEAGETLTEVATTLRSDASPIKSGDVIPSGVAPALPTLNETRTPLQPRERKALAERLDGLAGKLSKARSSR